LNARGDIFPLFSWLGVVMISIIIGYWFFANFFIEKEPLERMENDLKNIRAMIDDACETKYYKASYNPFTEHGTLDVNSSQLCIRTERMAKCRTVLCEKLPPETISIDLALVTDLVVEKSEDEDIVSVYEE